MSNEEHLSELASKKLSDEITAFTVKTLIHMSEDYPKDGDDVPLLDDIIAASEEQLENLTYNFTRIISGLKEAKK